MTKLDKDDQPGLTARLTAWALKLLPHHLLSSVMFRLSQLEHNWIKNRLIDVVISLFDIDLSEAEITNPHHYPSFNAFFIRKLKADARPIDKSSSALISPVDGIVSQLGVINRGQIIQAKKKDFSVAALLADNELARDFYKGNFATIYLSPRDYHRVHMPVTCKLLQITHIPGRLFSVNNQSVQLIDGLYARNERLVCLFETDLGKMILVMVGAIFVGSMETLWSGLIRPKSRHKNHWNPVSGEQNSTIAKGEEMGRFNLGSTVILLFENNKIQFSSHFSINSTVKMGQRIASHIKSDK